MKRPPLRAVLDTNVLVSALLFAGGLLLEDLLPWSESWRGTIPASRHRVRDPHNQVFLEPEDWCRLRGATQPPLGC